MRVPWRGVTYSTFNCNFMSHKSYNLCGSEDYSSVQHLLNSIFASTDLQANNSLPLRAGLLYLWRYHVSLCYTDHQAKFGKVQTYTRRKIVLIKQNSVKKYWEVKVKIYTILSSTLDVSGRCQIHDPVALPTGKMPPLMEGCVGPKADLGTVEKKVISFICLQYDHNSLLV
jgi:hypothetical protein